MLVLDIGLLFHDALKDMGTLLGYDVVDVGSGVVRADGMGMGVASVMALKGVLSGHAPTVGTARR